MACRLLSSGPLASLLVVLAVSWTLVAVAMAVREAGTPLPIHNTTATKYHSSGVGGGQQTRGEEAGYDANLNNVSSSHTPPGHLHTSAPRPSPANSKNNHIEQFVKLSNRTTNFVSRSKAPTRTPANKMGLVMPGRATPPPPRPPHVNTSSTQAGVGGVRRQVVAPVDLTLTPSLKLLLHQASSTPLPIPATSKNPPPGSHKVKLPREEEEDGKKISLLEDSEFCRQVEDLLLSLTRGGSVNSTRPHENLQTALGELSSSFPVRLWQKTDNKTSGRTGARRRSFPAAQLLVQHMDGSTVEGALLPTLTYKGKI